MSPGSEGCCLVGSVTEQGSALLLRNNLTDTSFLRGSPGGASGKEPASHSRDSLRSLGQEDALYCCLVAQSCLTVCDPHGLQHIRLPVLHHLPNLHKLMSTESVMLSDHLILCRPLLLCLPFFPASGSFPRNQFSASGGQTIGASASVLSMKIQD